MEILFSTFLPIMQR